MNPDQAPADNLWTPQTIVALAGMCIVAGTVIAVFVIGTAETRSQTVGGVMAFGAAILQFYFGSSSGSQKKDERAARPLASEKPKETPAEGAPSP